MSRRIIYGVVVFFLVIGITPYLFGYITERQITQAVASVSTVKGVTITLQKYHRGWLHSRARFLVQVGEDPFDHSGNMIPSFFLETDITHGPFIVNSDLTSNDYPHWGRALVLTQLSTLPDQQTRVHQYLDDNLVFNANFFIHLWGDTRFTLKSPDFTYHHPITQDRFHWSGLNIEGELASALTMVRLYAHFSKVFIGKGQDGLHFTDLKIDNRYNKGSFDLWGGNTKIELPFLMLTSQGKEHFIAEGIDTVIHHQLRDNIVNMATNLRVDSVIVDEVAYGPGEYGLVTNNLDAKAFSQLEEIIARIILEQQNPMHPDPLQDIKAVILHLLSHGLQVQLSPFTSTTPDGEISLQAWLTLPNMHKQKPYKPVDLQYLWQKADGYGRMTVPKSLLGKLVSAKGLVDFANRLTSDSWLQRALMKIYTPPGSVPTKVDHWIIENLLAEEGDHYSFVLDYKNGEFYLNGRLQDGDSFISIAEILPDRLA